jgi:hypothetical protein
MAVNGASKDLKNSWRPKRSWERLEELLEEQLEKRPDAGIAGLPSKRSNPGLRANIESKGQSKKLESKAELRGHN